MTERNDGGNRMKMRDRKLTWRQGLVAYWLPLTLIIALLGILLAVWLGTPSSSSAAVPGKKQNKCLTARGSRHVNGTLGDLFHADIAFTFCASTRTGVITYAPTPRLHWGMDDAGRITGWHADGRCGGSGPGVDASGRNGGVVRKVCFKEIGGATHKIAFTIRFGGRKGGLPFYAVLING